MIVHRMTSSAAGARLRPNSSGQTGDPDSSSSEPVSRQELLSALERNRQSWREEPPSPGQEIAVSRLTEILQSLEGIPGQTVDAMIANVELARQRRGRRLQVMKHAGALTGLAAGFAGVALLGSHTLPASLLLAAAAGGIAASGWASFKLDLPVLDTGPWDRLDHFQKLYADSVGEDRTMKRMAEEMTRLAEAVREPVGNRIQRREDGVQVGSIWLPGRPSPGSQLPP